MTGRTLGHYVVGDRLGAGGMGEVYRARDTRLERDVALKVLSSEEAGSGEATRKLRNEALALSRLNHPHIAAVYDFDVDGDVAFVVMELVSGVDLRDRLRSGPIPENEALGLAAQAADALHAAHSAGVVHRDLKPGNLRVTPDGRLKVLDFGLATLPAGGTLGDPTRTASAMVAGTLPYMAPEQLRAAPSDPRSDIYALCAVLYEMACGRRPLAAETDAMLIDQILNTAPEPLTARIANVSAGLDAIVQKGLEKDPNRRYQSARELLVDLERLRTPSASRPASTPRPPAPRSRLAWPVAAAVLIAVTGAWLAWRASSAGPALAFAPREWLLIADFDNQTGESMFDGSLAAALNVGLSQSTYANVIGRARIDQALGRMGRKDSPRIVESLGREICLREGIRELLAPGISRIGQQYSLTARLIDPTSGAAVRSYVQQAGDADGILDALGRIADTVRRDLGESLASISHDSRPLPQVTTASLEALTSYADGQTQWAKGRYREAVVHFERAIALDGDFAMAHAGLGNALLSFVFNEPTRGRTHFERALALSDRITERERMILQADYQQRLGDRTAAVDLYRAFLFRYPDDYTVRYNAAGTLREMGRYDEAVVEYEHAIRLSPSNASALINLATTHVQAGRQAEALAAYDRAFAIEPSWKTGGNLNHEYGFTFVRANRLADARQVFALTESSAGERPRGLRSHALLDMYEGRYRSAETRLSEAVRLDGPLNRPLSEARDRTFLAVVQDALGRRKDAIENLDRAVDLLRPLDGVAFLVRVGVLFARSGERERAQRVLTLARSKTPEEPALSKEVERLEAEILLANGRTDAALELFQSAARQAQRPALIQDSLGSAFRRSGRIEEAVASYQALLKTDALGWEPQHAWFEAHYQLALLEEKRGDRTAALGHVHRLVNLWRDGDADLPLLTSARRLKTRLSQQP